MSRTAGGTPGGWRNKKIKQEPGGSRELQKGRYYHIMPDVGSEDDEEDGKKGEKGTRTVCFQCLRLWQIQEP